MRTESRSARRCGRAGALVAVAGALLAGPSAVLAHEPATVVIVSPAGGARVSGRFDVVLEGRGGPGTEAASFTLLLDGEPVDTFGRVGAEASLFRSHQLAGGDRMVLTVNAGAGRHELRVRYAADEDSRTADVVRSFVVTGQPSRGIGLGALAALLGAVVAVGVAVVVRRKAMAGHGRSPASARERSAA